MKNWNRLVRRISGLVALSLPLSACLKQSVAESAVPTPPANGVGRYGYEVIRSYPHDRGAFTQGLLFYQGSVIEGTGLNGESTLREVDWRTGHILKQISLPQRFFGEGVTIIDHTAFQLTWQNHVGFIYDADTFQKLGEFQYAGEGWGLTTDGKDLILSDGTDRIRFLDPKTFAVRRTIEVRNAGAPVDQLNELEYVHGEIFANVWQTNQVVRIAPDSGRVVGVVDFSGLLSPADRQPGTDVLNGIAYDPGSDRLLVTGKRWPKMFEVRLRTQR